MIEKKVRKEVKRLRSFYMDVLNYALVNGLLILVWLLFDSGSSFWPKYVLVIWGIVLLVKGYRVGVYPALIHRLHFMSDDWEEKKVNEMMGRKGKDSQKKIDGRTKK